MVKWKLLGIVASPAALIGCQADVPVTPAEPVTVATAATAPAPAADTVPILALGDSLFVGYGLAPGQSYPARLEAALQARGIPARIVNAGVSGDTSADGLARADFVLKSMPKKPALVIISLGGNDLLRAVPPAETRKSMAALLAKFAEARIPVVVMGMLAPLTWGRTGLQAGLLMNFNTERLKDGVQRIVNGYIPFAAPRLRVNHIQTNE